MAAASADGVVFLPSRLGIPHSALRISKSPANIDLPELPLAKHQQEAYAAAYCLMDMTR